MQAPSDHTAQTRWVADPASPQRTQTDRQTDRQPAGFTRGVGRSPPRRPVAASGAGRGAAAATTLKCDTIRPTLHVGGRLCGLMDDEVNVR